jgi:hypothetical protein
LLSSKKKELIKVKALEDKLKHKLKRSVKDKRELIEVKRARLKSVRGMLLLYINCRGLLRLIS